jgi:guanylate kinase
LINAVLPRLKDTLLAKSATTRPKRADERQGREYYFLRPDEFEQRVKQGDFLEHVKYGANRYGTLKSEATANLEAGRNVILEIEVEGARNIKSQIPEALMIFIEPPSIEELGKRLLGRGTETGDEIQIRLDQARAELAEQDKFDYIVINKDVDQAADELERVIEANLQGG